MILEGQGQARLHLKSIPSWSHEWGPVQSQRTADYQNWVEAYARNHAIPIEWAEKGVRKEDHVLPWLRRMEKRNAYGVYFIFKSMEQGPTFRISLPKYPAKDPHYRIVAHQRSRFTHCYFYVRDEGLGPMVVRVASFFPFQTTYYLNGHSFIEQELKRAGIGFRKEDNAFKNLTVGPALSRPATPWSGVGDRPHAAYDAVASTLPKGAARWPMQRDRARSCHLADCSRRGRDRVASSRAPTIAGRRGRRRPSKSDSPLRSGTARGARELPSRPQRSGSLH